MAIKKKYANVELYEKKFVRVMERMGVSEGNYSYDFARREAWFKSQ